MKKVGKNGITNITINKHFKNDRLYGGCMPKNLLKFMSAVLPRFYILNLQSSNQGDKKGSHWCVLWNCNRNEIYYFDAFGVAPPNEVIEFMRRTNKKGLYSDSVFQDLDSNECGPWSILFCDLMHRHTFRDVIENIFPSMIPNYIELDKIKV